MLAFVCILSFFFFFKQKTAYEIVSRDWSSDVCSSDLCRLIALLQFKHEIAVLFDKMVFIIVGNSLIKISSLIKIVLILITCRAYSLDVDGNVANLPLLVTAGIVTTITYL